MSVFLVNPSDNSFGTAVITPRWLFVLAAATPPSVGNPILIDESLEPIDPERIQPGDIVGISPKFISTNRVAFQILLANAR